MLLAVLIGMVANRAAINAALFLGIGALPRRDRAADHLPVFAHVWSAIDLIMRPLAPEEVADAQAAVATAAMAGDAAVTVCPPPPDRADR